MKKITTSVALLATLAAPAAMAVSEYEVSFGTYHGTYVKNEQNGGLNSTVSSDATALGSWETMYMTNLSETEECISNGSTITIRSDDGWYWQARPKGGLHVNVLVANSYEKFQLINHTDSSGCIADGDQVSIYSLAHGTYVVAESNGDTNVNRTKIGTWEKFTLSATQVVEQAPVVSGRQETYRAQVLAEDANSVDAMTILAYEGQEIPADLISDSIDNINESSVADFRLTQLIRVLYLSSGQYEDDLLPTLSGLDYWLTSGEDRHVYWSENHMIMWTSAAYLMRQKYGWDMDSDLDNRLGHWLDLKLEHGFYEFFSTVYYRYTLAALLNLADFAENTTIKAKAAKVAQDMMAQMGLVVNSSGAFYPAAGRNYNNKYTSFDPKATFWMLFGKGPMRDDADYGGGIFATTSVDFEGVARGFDATVNTTLSFGHGQDENETVHSGFTRDQRTIFQWSSGGYFHPDTASDTAYAVDYFNMEERSEFSDLAAASGLPDSWMGTIADIAATYSRASSLSKATVKIWKNYNVGLTSLYDFYPGYKGYQQWPWVATLGDIAIWTQSGTIPSGWATNGNASQNAHLPRVRQEDNVAMITYFPNYEIRQGTGSKRVTLHWPTERFDEHGETNGYLVARKGTTYIAVRRPGDELNADGYPTNWGDKGRQMWAVVVGNSSTHGSYDDFLDVINAATSKVSYSYDVWNATMVYYSRITVDGKDISYSW
jgi:hypothetical protein